MARAARLLNKLDTIRRFKGEVKIGMLLTNDVIYVKCVKADLLYMLADIPETEFDFFEQDGMLFVTNN